jgi:proteasome lid subunit RPN8/RPN11
VYEQQLTGGDSMRTPHLVIPFPVWQKMMAYILNCAYEINGFGFVSVTRDVITIEDVFILPQVATAGSVETDAKALQDFDDELRQSGNGGSMRFQWHSHVKMPAFFSNDDLEVIRAWPGDWLISLVANQYGQFRCQLDFRKPFRMTVPLRPQIPTPVPEDLGNKIRDDIRQMVRTPRKFGGLGRRKGATSDEGPSWGDPDEFVMFDEEAVR